MHRGLSCKYLRKGHIRGDLHFVPYILFLVFFLCFLFYNCLAGNTGHEWKKMNAIVTWCVTQVEGVFISLSNWKRGSVHTITRVISGEVIREKRAQAMFTRVTWESNALQLKHHGCSWRKRDHFKSHVIVSDKKCFLPYCAFFLPSWVGEDSETDIRWFTNSAWWTGVLITEKPLRGVFN